MIKKAIRRQLQRCKDSPGRAAVHGANGGFQNVYVKTETAHVWFSLA